MKRKRLLSRMDARAVAWLRDAGVPVDVVAEGFAITPGHVRVVHLRARRPPTLKRAKRIGSDAPEPRSIRREEDAVDLANWQIRRIDALAERVTRIRQLAEESWDLRTASSELKRLLPYPGFAASIRLIRVRAMIHEQLAWCQVHQRQAHAAFFNAAKAYELFDHVHRQTDERSDLIRLGEVSLIASQACVAAGHVGAARHWHQVHQRDHARSNEKLNVEFFRQRGTAALLAGQADVAELQFEQAGRAVDGVEALWWKAHAGYRPLAVINGDWELAAEALETIQSERSGGLEEASAITWARGAAISSESEDGYRWSARIAAQSANLLARFPRHQELVRLLNLTDNLRRLNATSESLNLRRRWVRWLLYQSDAA